jgi:hypothetical protein
VGSSARAGCSSAESADVTLPAAKPAPAKEIAMIETAAMRMNGCCMMSSQMNLIWLDAAARDSK